MAMDDLDFGQYPNMGISYNGLANMTQPQMMGNAPVGAGATAGLQYGRDKARHDGFINKAAELAQLDAQMKALQAEEANFSQPMRKDALRLKGERIKGSLAELPEEFDTRRLEREARGVKAKSAIQKEAEEKLSKWASRWNSAPDEETKRDMLDEMEKEGITTLGKRVLKQAPIDRIDSIMKGITGGEYNHPKLRTQREIAAGRVQGQKDVATIRAEADTERTRIAAEAKKWADQYKADAAAKAKEGSKSLTTWEREMHEKGTKGELTPEQQKGFENYLHHKYVLRAWAALEGKPPEVDPEKVGGGVLKNPRMPPAPGLPPQSGPKKDADKPKLDLDKKMFGSKKIIGFNDKGEYQLEDGTIVDKDGNIK